MNELGGRHAILTRVAGTMRRRGMTVDEIGAALSAANVARCDPPLDENEVRAIAESVARYPASARGDLSQETIAQLEDLVRRWHALDPDGPVIRALLDVLSEFGVSEVEEEA